VLSVVATCTVLLAGGMMAARGRVTVGLLVAFMTYISRMFAPIRELSQLYATLQSAGAGGERVLQLLDTPPAVSDSPTARDPGPLQGRIEFRGVRFEYNPGVEVLHGVDLAIEPGETVAIVGPTGAGKTTITNLVCRFYEPSGGEILIDGIPIREIASAALHRQTGYVPQDPFLFSATIAENIAYARPEASREDVVRAARHAEAHTFIEHLPDGYETRVLEGGANLSTGQRQLISIARAVLADPRILIMDEATSGVDTLTEALIQRGLAYLLHGRTAIIIAHRLTTVRGADRILVLEDGNLVEEGDHDRLMAAGGVYRRLYERQFVGESSHDGGDG
jgi:ATP-binding cassette subfamily B protein